MKAKTIYRISKNHSTVVIAIILKHETDAKEVFLSRALLKLHLARMMSKNLHTKYQRRKCLGEIVIVKSAKRLWSRVSSRNSETTGSLRSSQRSRYNQASKSRQIAIQGMLYVCAFYITWLFPTLQRITELAVSKNFYVFSFLRHFLAVTSRNP